MGHTVLAPKLSANSAAPGASWNAGNLSGAVSAGDKLIAVVMVSKNPTPAPTATGITDSLGNVWVKDPTTQAIASSGGFVGELSTWQCVSLAGTPSNITVAISGTPGLAGISIISVSGLLGSTGAAGIDISKYAAGSAATADSGTTAGTTGAATELKLGLYADQGETKVLTLGTVDTTYTLGSKSDNNANAETLIEYADTGAAGSTAQAQVGNAGAQWGMAVIVYKDAPSGGVGPRIQPLLLQVRGYALFQPFLRHRLPAPDLGIVNTLLEPAAATMTFTGQGPTADSVINPAAATMTFTGQGPSLDSGIIPAAATMVFTGQTPSLGSSINPAAASMVFTGQTATLASVINPASASMVFTGQSPRLDSVINPAAATMTFTGQTPTANVGFTLNPAAASMVFTGQGPVLAAVVNPAAASMVFTGQLPTVVNSGGTTTTAPAIIYLLESGRLAVHVGGIIYEEL